MSRKLVRLMRVAKRQSDPLDTGRSHATSPPYAVLNFIVSGKQMEQIEPALFATLKQDAVILRSTRTFYRKGGSSQLYCHELVVRDNKVANGGPYRCLPSRVAMGERQVGRQ